MMSGLPTTRRSICGPWPFRSVRRTAPASKRTNSISSDDPIAPRTTASRSARVVAAAIPLWKAFRSGRPIVAVRLWRISSNGLDETRLVRRTGTSIVAIVSFQFPRLANRGENLVQGLLTRRVGIDGAFVNVRRRHAIEPEAQQFRPAVVAARVHQLLALVDQREVE